MSNLETLSGSKIPPSTAANRKRYHAVVDSHGEEWAEAHREELGYVWGQVYGFGRSVFNDEVQRHVCIVLDRLESL